MGITVLLILSVFIISAQHTQGRAEMQTPEQSQDKSVGEENQKVTKYVVPYISPEFV